MSINCSTNCTAPCTPWFIVLNYIVLKRNIRQVQKFVASVHTFSSQLPPLFIGSLCPPWPAASDWKWLNYGDTIILAGSVSPSWVYHRLSTVPLEIFGVALPHEMDEVGETSLYQAASLGISGLPEKEWISLYDWFSIREFVSFWLDNWSMACTLFNMLEVYLTMFLFVFV